MKACRSREALPVPLAAACQCCGRNGIHTGVSVFQWSSSDGLMMFTPVIRLQRVLRRDRLNFRLPRRADKPQFAEMNCRGFRTIAAHGPRLRLLQTEFQLRGGSGNPLRHDRRIERRRGFTLLEGAFRARRVEAATAAQQGAALEDLGNPVHEYAHFRRQMPAVRIDG